MKHSKILSIQKKLKKDKHGCDLYSIIVSCCNPLKEAVEDVNCSLEIFEICEFGDDPDGYYLGIEGIDCETSRSVRFCPFCGERLIFPTPLVTENRNHIYDTPKQFIVGGAFRCILALSLKAGRGNG